MKSTNACKNPKIDKSKIDSNWTLKVDFRVRVSKKRREQIAAEKNYTILSAIEMGSVFAVKKMIEKGHPELKDNAHYYMCCVYVPKDGRSRKVALDEAIKHFESYEKEVIGAQYNQTFVSL